MIFVDCWIILKTIFYPKHQQHLVVPDLGPNGLQRLSAADAGKPLGQIKKEMCFGEHVWKF